MKPERLLSRGWCWLLIVLTSLTAAYAQQATAPALGPAAAYGLLSGDDVRATNSAGQPLPIQVQGKAGATDKIDSGVQASAGRYEQNSGTVPDALLAAQAARAYCTSLGGSSLGSQLGGQTLGAGAYAVSGNAALDSPASLTLTGDTATVIVLNVAGSLAVGGQAQVVLDGVRPGNVFWNIGGDLTVAAGASFSGVALTGGSITLTGGQFGHCALLSGGLLQLTGLSAIAGNNRFFAPAAPLSPQGVGNCTFTPLANELVQDGSLEEARYLPTLYEGLHSDPANGLLSDSCYWQWGSEGTPDYYYAGGDPRVAVPGNEAGNSYTLSGNTVTVTPHDVPALNQNTTDPTGSGYAGLLAYDEEARSFEYVAQRIDQPLRSGHRYYAAFWARLAPVSTYRVAHLGVALAPANWLAGLPNPPAAGRPGGAGGYGGAAPEYHSRAAE